ncbi:MAG TPA: HlyD family efflux transporter periplasmic adaptor subunit [Caldilineae bacterium]|nr:HlyD family efflux transporter periplasmic adaptor subunit [Caldilineae bacterium]
MLKRILIVIAIVAVLGIAAWQGYLFAQREPEAVQGFLTNLEFDTGKPSGRLIASGIIEAHQVEVAPEVGGIIVDIPVDEGDEVEEGQILVQLDTDLIDAQLEQAAAVVAVARAQLELVKAGPREEDVRQAQAAVRLAEAMRDAARQAWEDAKALRDNPQELDIQLISARIEVAIAEKQVIAAEANARAMDLEHEMWGRMVRYLSDGFDVVLPGGFGFHYEPGSDKIQAANLQWNLSGQKAWEAWQQVEEAKAQLLSAQARLRNLEAKRENPVELQIQVDQAEAQFHGAEAQVEQAKAELARLLEGASQEQIEVAEAGLKQAESALDHLMAQREKFTLRAPRSGVVVARPANRGEAVVPGTPLLKIADLDQVTLTVYVPEDKIGLVRLGDEVSVTVDSFPDRTFIGRVTYIADRAEFTPKNVQTAEERVNMVFAVKITLPNPDHDLKPGMPADADFGPIK